MFLLQDPASPNRISGRKRMHGRMFMFGNLALLDIEHYSNILVMLT